MLTKKDVIGCYPELYDDPEKPLHVLILDKSKLRSSERVVCHLWTADLPEGVPNRGLAPQIAQRKGPRQALPLKDAGKWQTPLFPLLFGFAHLRVL